MLLTDEKLNEIVAEIEAGTCVPFLGSAASISSDGYQGPPIGTQLAKQLADECVYPGDDTWNLPRVAQFYEYKKGRTELIDELFSRIYPYTEPSPLHTLISQICSNFKVIITTNYDRLMELALGANCIPFVHDPTAEKPPDFFPPRGFEGPVLFKMHGTIEKASSIIITEDDYIEFLTKLKPNDLGIPSNIPLYFMTPLTTCRLLFIGYGLEDFNFKVLFKGAIERLPKYHKRTSYAIQRKSSDSSEEYWNFSEKYWSDKGIEIFDIDVYDFAHRLADKLGVQI